MCFVFFDNLLYFPFIIFKVNIFIIIFTKTNKDIIGKKNLKIENRKS